MYRNPNPYIPRTIGEVWDFLGSMMLSAPTFIDKIGDFPNRNIETEFFALNEGLKVIRERLGQEKYRDLVELSDRMRGYFESDPKDQKGEANKGRECILEMEEILRVATRGSPEQAGRTVRPSGRRR